MLLELSSRLPADQLRRPAWQLLEAGFVCAAVESAAVKTLREAGVSVTVLVDPADLGDALDAYETVVLLHPGDEAPPDLSAFGGRADRPPQVIVGSVDPSGAALLSVVAVMDRLRSPGGCPWDAEQTHASLMPYLLEETYEAYQALEDHDPVALREELGDVLLQVVFHSRLAEEAAESWSIEDVAADLVAKLVRRHPHVFATMPVNGGAEVPVNGGAEVSVSGAAEVSAN